MPTSTQQRSNVVSIQTGDHRQRVLATRDQLVEAHMDLARSIARNVFANVPNSFDLDDLTQTAFVALVRVATRYRPREHAGVPFSAFARPAIRGAVLETVRRRHYEASTRPSIDDMPEPAVAPVVEISIDRTRRNSKLRDALGYLSPREAEVVIRYYEGSAEGKISFSKVGKAMGIHRVTAQRVHATAMAKLRVRAPQLLRDAA